MHVNNEALIKFLENAIEQLKQEGITVTDIKNVSISHEIIDVTTRDDLGPKTIKGPHSYIKLDYNIHTNSLIN